MSGTVADRKRLIRITAGNIRNNHIYVAGHYDFFPADAIGGSRRTNGNASPIKIHLTGLNITVETDIGTDGSTGKPRRMLRGRKWVRDFFEHHEIKTGDVLAIERTGPKRYRLYPFDAKSDRNFDWHDLVREVPRGKGPTVLELFAGCGGMALGFKNAGFRTALAAAWGSDACDTLRANSTERIARSASEKIDRFALAGALAGVATRPRTELPRQPLVSHA